MGSCPHGTGTVELARADLIVYELDVAALAWGIAEAMGLARDHGPVEGVPHATRVGVRDPLAEDEAWVYQVLQAGPPELADALTRRTVAAARRCCSTARS